MQESTLHCVGQKEMLIQIRETEKAARVRGDLFGDTTIA